MSGVVEPPHPASKKIAEVHAATPIARTTPRFTGRLQPLNPSRLYYDIHNEGPLVSGLPALFTADEKHSLDHEERGEHGADDVYVDHDGHRATSPAAIRLLRTRYLYLYCISCG